MITVPDALNGNKSNVNTVTAFNSVRQIIINFNQSNCGSDDRPVILFYEGPERYDPNNPLRESKPIIVNFNAPFRAILYAPNRPVVVVGNHQNDFKGFIVAKKYMRLKTDFVLAGRKYYKLVEDGITMFTDKYGNVQYAEFSVQPTKCGQYDTFGRTDFTTHNYHIAKNLANNLLRTAQ